MTSSLYDSLVVLAHPWQLTDALTLCCHIHWREVHLWQHERQTVSHYPTFSILSRKRETGLECQNTITVGNSKTCKGNKYQKRKWREMDKIKMYASSFRDTDIGNRGIVLDVEGKRIVKWNREREREKPSQIFGFSPYITWHTGLLESFSLYQYMQLNQNSWSLLLLLFLSNWKRTHCLDQVSICWCSCSVMYFLRNLNDSITETSNKTSIHETSPIF